MASTTINASSAEIEKAEVFGELLQKWCPAVYEGQLKSMHEPTKVPFI
jgi:hypothetical protein